MKINCLKSINFLVAALLLSGSVIHTKSLHKAVDNGDLDTVEALLKTEDGKAQLNTPNKAGLYPLHEASSQCDTEMMRLLLESGAQANVKAEKNNNTPLHFCHWCNEMRNFSRAVTLLLSHKADLEAKDKYGSTLLDRIISFHASFENRDEEAKHLVSQGAQLTLQSYNRLHSPNSSDALTKKQKIEFFRKLLALQEQRPQNEEICSVLLRKNNGKVNRYSITRQCDIKHQ